LVVLSIASLSSFGFGCLVVTGGCRLCFCVPFSCVAFCLEVSALGFRSYRFRLWVVVVVVCSTLNIPSDIRLSAALLSTAQWDKQRIWAIAVVAFGLLWAVVVASRKSV
jgi:hypothetical protein